MIFQNVQSFRTAHLSDVFCSFQKDVACFPHVYRAFVHQSAATMHLPADIGKP